MNIILFFYVLTIIACENTSFGYKKNSTRKENSRKVKFLLFIKNKIPVVTRTNIKNMINTNHYLTFL
jgi:hypothetical protein